MLRHNPYHKHAKHISLYLYSHYVNLEKNTPEIIEARLKIFFPNIIIFFAELHESFKLNKI